MVYCGLFSVPMKCFKEKYFDNFSVNIVLSIYNFGYLKYDLTEDELKETFVASNGWWHRFSKRYNLSSENLLGEAGSADHKAAAEFPEKLKKIIDGKDLSIIHKPSPM